MRAHNHQRPLVPLGCAAVAVIAYCLLVGPLLASRGPIWFMHVGRKESDPPTLRQVEHILGSNYSASANYGHDGREFWVLAQDPLLLAPRRDMRLLDRPAYRAARIAYPLAVAPWRLFGMTGLAFGLLATNLLVVGAGTYFIALLALRLNAPVWATAFFAASPVVIVAVLLDLGDALSLAALVASFYLADKTRWGWATLAGVVAVLAKQPALFGIVAIAVSSHSASWRWRFWYVAVPAVALIGWTAYATVRLGTAGDLIGFTLPFLGYVRASQLWLRDQSWADAATALSLLPGAGLIAARWWRTRSQVLTVALPFAVMVPFLSREVLWQTIDSVRAFGPAITFFGLDWLRDQKVCEEPPVLPVPRWANR